MAEPHEYTETDPPGSNAYMQEIERMAPSHHRQNVHLTPLQSKTITFQVLRITESFPSNQRKPTQLLLFSYSSQFQTTKKMVNTKQHTPYVTAPITERKPTNSKQIIHINRHNHPIAFGYGLIYQQITQRLTIQENPSIIPQNNHRLFKNNHIYKFPILQNNHPTINIANPLFAQSNSKP